MEIVIDKIDNKTIVKVSGRMNSSNASEFEQKFSDLVNNEDTFVIIDLADLEYISSAGLRVILSAYKKIKGLDGRLVLCNLQEIVQQVFDLAGFSTIFEIAPDIDKIQ